MQRVSYPNFTICIASDKLLSSDISFSAISLFRYFFESYLNCKISIDFDGGDFG